jgi:hypothetical protein
MHLTQVWSRRLVQLELSFCGRGFGATAAAAFAAAGPFQGLRELRLAGAYRLQPADVARVVAAAPQLTALGLPDCSWLQGATVTDIAARLPGITRLDLARCRGIDVEGLATGLASLPGLGSLSLGANISPEFACVWVGTGVSLAYVCWSRRLWRSFRGSLGSTWHGGVWGSTRTSLPQGS